MPYATTDDGVRLYFDEAGSGTPLVFVHEFAGDHRSWEPQMRRPSLWELTEDMKRIQAPALIVSGDEDDPRLEPALLMKRSIATAGLAVLPRTGHTINLEEPELFNRTLLDFFTLVDEGRWGARDPRSMAAGILGFK